MNKESFIMETLRKQYQEEIHSAWVESEHKGKVDFKALGTKLKKLMKSAKVQGLPAKDFDDILSSIIPEEIVGKIDYSQDLTHKKKAA